MANRKADLEESDLVRKLGTDPDQPANLTIFAGYLGKSSREGYWRLYPTPDMKDYMEIAESDIVHSQALETRDNPLGGTMVWVKSDAEIVRTQTDKASAQAGFLSGGITNSMLSMQRLGNLGGSANLAIPTTPQCIMATITIATMAVCRTLVFDCPSEDCYSAPVLCTIRGYPGC